MAATKLEVITDRRKVEIREGQPFPRGAMWDGKGVNFALFSANATRVELCLFDEEGKEETQRIDLPEFTDEIWHGYIPGLSPARYTAIAFTARTNRKKAIASIPINFYSILMRVRI